MNSTINNIEVNEPIILNNMETETLKKQVKLEDLSPEEKKQLLAELEADQNLEKQKVKDDRLAWKKLAEETVPNALFKLIVASEMLTNAKTDVFKYFENLINLKGEIFGKKEGQQSHTFSCETGEITIGYRINEGWDDTANSGIAKVEKYLESKAKDSESASLVKTIFNLLKKDAKGNLKANRVIELKRTADESGDAEFIDGVNIILNGHKKVRSVWYVEASIINDGKKTNIPLNISSVDFCTGYTFDMSEKN